MIAIFFLLLAAIFAIVTITATFMINTSGIRRYGIDRVKPNWEFSVYCLAVAIAASLIGI